MGDIQECNLMDFIRKIARKQLREVLLQEALFDINIDVSFIYDRYFKKDIEYIEKTGRVRKEMFSRGATNTGELLSDASKSAHKKNPCTILINNSEYKGHSNYYNPFTSKISITLNENARKYMFDYINYKNVEEEEVELVAEKYFDGDIKNSFIQEFTEQKIKGSIHHELIHWLDDTFHNYRVKGELEKSKIIGREKYFKTKNINTTSMEIQAQMGNVQQLKNKNNDIWDLISFVDMIKMSSALKVVYKRLDFDERKYWIKKLKQRMHREGLLGANMIN